MKFLKKTTMIVIVLVASILITWQVVDKSKRMSEIKPKDKYQVKEQHMRKSLLSKVNKDVSTLTYRSKSLTRITVDDPSSSPVLYCSPNRTLKQVALTFDDGPDIYYTPQILKILKRNNIKATFFIVLF